MSFNPGASANALGGAQTPVSTDRLLGYQPSNVSAPTQVVNFSPDQLATYVANNPALVATSSAASTLVLDHVNFGTIQTAVGNMTVQAPALAANLGATNGDGFWMRLLNPRGFTITFATGTGGQTILAPGGATSNSSAGVYTFWGTQVAGTLYLTVDMPTAAAAPAVPGQVTGLTVGTMTSTTSPLTWTAPASGGAVANYTVEYRVTSVGGAYTVASSTIAAGTTAYTVTGLTASTGYDFRITATNAGGSGTPSTVATGTTSAAGAVNSIVFTGAAGAATGNQIVTPNTGSTYTGVLDGSGHMIGPTAASAQGTFRAMGARGDGTFTCNMGASSSSLLEFVVLVRCDTTGANCYAIDNNPANTHCFIYKIVAGSATLLNGGTSSTTAMASTCAVTISGTTISVYWDGVLAASVVDGSVIASGYVGFGRGGASSTAMNISSVAFA